MNIKSINLTLLTLICGITFTITSTAAEVAITSNNEDKSELDKHMVRSQEKPEHLEKGAPYVLVSKLLLLELDVNKDGHLDREEVVSKDVLAENFSSIDISKDGTLDITEIKNMFLEVEDSEELNSIKREYLSNPDVRSNIVFFRMDINSDNKLEKKETSGFLFHSFDKLDINSDGFIDKVEYSDFRSKIEAKREEKRNKQKK